MPDLLGAAASVRAQWKARLPVPAVTRNAERLAQGDDGIDPMADLVQVDRDAVDPIVPPAGDADAPRCARRQHETQRLLVDVRDRHATIDDDLVAIPMQ